jgi:hypothetical protein
MGPAWKPVERPSMHNITDVELIEL